MKTDHNILPFPLQKYDKAQLINIGIASNGRFIMTCYKDTTMKVWTLKGNSYRGLLIE